MGAEPVIPEQARDIILNGWDADKTVGHIRDLLAEIGEDLSESQVRYCVRMAHKWGDPRAKRRTNAVYSSDF